MPKKRNSKPDHRAWMTGDTISIDHLTLRVVAVLHDDRCSTFSLVDDTGATYRYAPPLKIYRTN